MAKAKLQTPSSKLQAATASPARTSQLPAPSSRLKIEEILPILKKWGIHTLGQLVALNKEKLRKRLGPDAVRLWERANGTANRPLKFVQPPETFDESFEFDHEIETAEPLLFILRRFLEQLALRLSSIYLVARELTLTINFSKSELVTGRIRPIGGPDGYFAKPTAASKERHIRVFKIPEPTNDVDLLFRMLQTHLENFKSEHPIVAVSLSAQSIRPASQQFGLFETALRNPHQLYETLARLTALVGNDRVGTPVLEETHRPDAFRMENFVWQVGASPSQTGNILNRPIGGPRPPLQKTALRRFRPPANAAIFVCEGKYLSRNPSRRHACHHSFRGQIIDQIGPFLLSGNWWDENAWARAEWDMQLESGELVRAHESEGIWKLDGIYD